MPRPSIAKEFYDNLVVRNDAFAHMMAWIKASPPVVETEWLDFKGWRADMSGEKIKEIWSKALTGFANTQGGVLVWGLDCRKEGDPPIDRVCGAALVCNPDAFASRLMELHHQATEPPVLSVEIRSVLDPSAESWGLAL